MGSRIVTASCLRSVETAGALSKRLARAFTGQMEDWREVCQRAEAWEASFQTDSPSPQAWAEHLELLEELEQVGRFLGQAAQGNDLLGQDTFDRIAEMLQELRKRRLLWRGRMKQRQREALLRDIFKED